MHRASYYYFLLLLSCSSKSIDSIPALNKLLSKNYFVKFSIETSFFSNEDSVFAPRKNNSFIERAGDYIYSKIDNDIGIMEDSNILYIDIENKIINIGPKKIVGFILISPVHDPYELWDYAKKYNIGFIKSYENGMVAYDFVFGKKDEPMYQVVFAFDRQKSNILNIKLVYQRLSLIVRDEVTYEFVSNLAIDSKKKINDFVEIKNGRYAIKQDFHDFTLFDSHLLHTK